MTGNLDKGSFCEMLREYLNRLASRDLSEEELEVPSTVQTAFLRFSVNIGYGKRLSKERKYMGDIEGWEGRERERKGGLSERCQQGCLKG